jgi:hypothetical protein
MVNPPLMPPQHFTGGTEENHGNLRFEMGTSEALPLERTWCRLCMHLRLRINATVLAYSKGTPNRPEGPEGSGSIALLFLDLGTRRGRWSAPRPRRFTPRKDPVPIVPEAPGPVWTCTKNLAPNGIRSPDRPARSQSLYRLSYPGPIGLQYVYKRTLRLQPSYHHRPSTLKVLRHSDQHKH